MTGRTDRQLDQRIGPALSVRACLWKDAADPLVENPTLDRPISARAGNRRLSDSGQTSTMGPTDARRSGRAEVNWKISTGPAR